jgi:type VI secretion system secreted protein Hcp
MHKKFASLVAGAMILATAASASAANSIFMTLTGQKSGAVKGSVTQKGRENSIQVLSIEDEVVSPRDAASGLPTGKRQHKPISVKFEIDASAPILYNMITSNENITQLELKFYRPSPSGVESQYYSVKLTNANIASIRAATDPTTHDTMLDVTFTYQKIQWTWTDGANLTAADNWTASAI